MPELIPCRACARHVAAVESSCPFCGASCADAPSIDRPALGRVPRAVVFGAALLGAAAAGCGARSGPDPDRDSGPADAAVDTGPLAMPYGAPPSRARSV